MGRSTEKKAWPAFSNVWNSYVLELLVERGLDLRGLLRATGSSSSRAEEPEQGALQVGREIDRARPVARA